MPQTPLIRRFEPSDYIRMPWKNGLGFTTELAISPPGANLTSAFHWRLSIAELSASGPFSRMDGIERTIIQIEGAPMRLTHAGHGEHQLNLLEPYTFQGEWDTHGHLGGAARDFNVMVARATVRAQVSVQRLRAGAELALHSKADEVALYCLNGTVVLSLPRGDKPVRQTSGSLVLVAREEGETDMSLLADGAAVVFVVEFDAL